MKNRKKYTQIAKLMFKNSLKNGALDAKLAGKVLSQVTSQKPYGLYKILAVYKKLIARQISKEEIVVEASTLPSFNKNEFLKKTGAKRISVKINPEIIFGAKISHGDWIWEETLNSKLEQIKKGI